MLGFAQKGFRMGRHAFSAEYKLKYNLVNDPVFALIAQKKKGEKNNRRPSPGPALGLRAYERAECIREKATGAGKKTMREIDGPVVHAA